MRKPEVRGLVGAALAIAAFFAAAALPAALGDGSLHLPSARHLADACLVPACEPGPPGLVDRLDAALEDRIAGLEDDARRFLARTVVAEAEGARIDPLLVLALIEVESAWDPAALSGRGARGLMQLREPTLRRELERNGLALDDPRDPVANVRAGVRYLRRLLDAFGREEVALMAYNAGPNRILRYMEEEEDIPDRFRVYPKRIQKELGRLKRKHVPPSQIAANVPPGALSPEASNPAAR